MKISILDYGLGNMKSLTNALDKINKNYEIISEPQQLARAKKIILPGVGNFGTAMNNLTQKGLKKPLQQAVRKGTPCLGICLGLQILFEKSQESPSVKGLGLLKGNVVKFQCKEKIPQMGWNQICIQKRNPLLEKIPNQTFMYFVHSYYAQPENKNIQICMSQYGEPYCSMLAWENVYGTQFHPEKSGEYGLQILKNFTRVKV